MKTCIRCKEEKPVDEFRKNRNQCKECERELSREFENKNKEKRLAAKRQFYIDNREKERNRGKKYYANNKEKEAARYRKYKENNLEKLKAYEQKRAKENPAYFVAKTQKRHTAKLKRTPSWLTEQDWKEIESKYAVAAMLTVLTFGEKYHVDHIVPLQGKNVCGLHVPNNLRVIRAVENLSKGNRYE